jgi:hypothetical protein
MPSRLRPLLTEFLDLLQVHCAPMRDQEVVVEVAQPCVPGGVSTKADAVKAVRMCLDILELMKLDIVKVGAHLFNSRSSGSRLPINTCWLRKLFPILHYPHHPSAITLSAEHFKPIFVCSPCHPRPHFIVLASLPLAQTLQMLQQCTCF